MNKSQRIQLSADNLNQDKYIKVQLEQNIDQLEFLSMNLSAKDVYQDFNADYGVLIGRVIANGGVGIPNAKISIFIPLSDIDAENSDITSIYPYKTPRDKNNEGRRYNLLPRVGKVDPNTGIVSPKQPFGSFPIKEEVVTNIEFLDVYKKYYKYTALTNKAGDYMIFGVPIGTQTIHMSVDITDIGKYSMNPAAMVTNLGYSANLFTDYGSKIKPSTDLDDLPNIETQEITVDIIPFWGDTTNFTIGITRQDFRIRSVLTNTFAIFGSAFTDGDNSMWGEDVDNNNRRVWELYYMRTENEPYSSFNVSMKSKRITQITEKIYYYPASVSDTKINDGTADPITEMKILDKSEYSKYVRNGDFVFIISCNRNKIITNELGEEVPVDDNYPNGIFTKFRGFATLEISNDDAPMNFSQSLGSKCTIYPYRFKVKIPQFASKGHSFKRETNTPSADTLAWRKQHYTFSGGTLYTIAKFNATVQNTHSNNDTGQDAAGDGFLTPDVINTTYNGSLLQNTGVLFTNNKNITGNAQYEMVSNSYHTSGYDYFGANWLNFCLYFPQFSFTGSGQLRDVKTVSNFCPEYPFSCEENVYFLYDNSQPIAAGDVNTKWFARSDMHWTDFVEVPKTDVVIINKSASLKKGFKDNDTSLSGALTGKYRNGQYAPPNWSAACPYKGGRINGGSSTAIDPRKYFYKGFNKANCIEFITLLGLV